MTGRPSEFTQETADAICARLGDGESLRSICRDDAFPAQSTVFRWLADDRFVAFREQYTRARETQADTIFDQMLELADTCLVGEKVEKDADGKVVKVTSGDMIERSRLGIETRKWVLGKMAPKKYSDRHQVEHSGPDGGPIKQEVAVRPQMSREEWIKAYVDTPKGPATRGA